jgi:hypothetical protein
MCFFAEQVYEARRHWIIVDHHKIADVTDFYSSPVKAYLRLIFSRSPIMVLRQGIMKCITQIRQHRFRVGPFHSRRLRAGPAIFAIMIRACGQVWTQTQERWLTEQAQEPDEA